MAIQNRRGIFSDFDPDKMIPGEWAVVLSGDPDSKDGTSVYMCFHAGGVKRMATYADMLSNIENATEDIRNQFAEEILNVIKNAESAIENANSATDKANGAATSAESAAQKADEIAEKTNQQYEEMKKQAALIGDGNVGTVTGPRVDFESLDSAAVVKEIPGKTVQDRSTGAQLFDASKLPTKTQGGATVTNNGDGSFTVSGSGNLTSEFNISLVYTHEQCKQILKLGKINQNFREGTLPYPYGQIKANGKWYNFEHLNNITQDILNANDLEMYIGFYGSIDQSIKPGTIKPMLYQDGDGTWEPYTGGKPTPRPDYPVMVQGVGDSGYFDGVLLQGYYSIVDGTLVGASDYICNENKIPCNSGDEISITVKKDGIEDFQFLFYEKNGTYIGNAPNWTAKAQEGTAFVCFRMKKTGLTTRNAGHIAITINGKYMTMIKSRTANLFDYRRLPSKTQGGATVTNNGDGSFTVSGSGNLTSEFNNSAYYGFAPSLKVGTLKLNNVDVRPLIQVIGLAKKGTDNGTASDRSFLIDSTNKEISITQEIIDRTVDLKVIFYGAASTVIKPGTIKPILYQDGDGTYQPYKESSSVIPITQPLYTGDKIYQKDGELWLHRENAEVTFDGSEDENWVLYNGQFYTGKDDMKKSNSYVDNLFCDRFQTDTNNSAKNDNTITGHWDSALYPDKNWIYITKTDVESVSALKTWLQSNPVTVVYKLAVPIEEHITAEEAYNLRTYAPYSTIWTPDDLEPVFLVDTAKNLAGAYALEGYANREKGKEMFGKIEKIEEAMKNVLMVSG